VVVPDLAMQGYAHASGFTEYLMHKVPNVFDNVKGGTSAAIGGETLTTIQSAAPQAYDVGSQVGTSAASVIQTGGVEAFNQLKEAGGSVLKFLQIAHPEVLAVLVPTLAINFEGVTVLKDAAGVMSNAAPVLTNAAGTVASNVAPVFAEAAKGIAPVASEVAGQLSSFGSVAVDALGTGCFFLFFFVLSFLLCRCCW
jgi:hypothetical protein